ncbi:MAG: hypothetical protein DBW74_02365 [Cryomorphaceae bacterium]|nr:MAG: hypothetical protein DBW74_02365 [Cryomorphaceae bacterium]
MKYHKISEIAYLIIFLVVFFDIIFLKKTIDGNIPLLILGILSFLMFVFRRYYRKKFNNRKNSS